MSNADYDVIIVGAGISGALIANQLASKGAKVLILEAGKTPPTHQTNIDNFYSAAIKTPGAPYPPTADAPRPDVPLSKPILWNDPTAFNNDPRYYFVQTGPDAFGSTYERLTGGTTQHWLGTALRFLPEDFETQTKFGFATNWPLNYAELERYYTEAEKQIGVSGDAAIDDALGAKHSEPYPMKPVPTSWSDQVVKKALDGKVFDGKTISVGSTPQARNTEFYDKRPICMGNTSCVPICPIRAKYDATVHLKKAMAQSTPVTLQTKSVVHKVLADPVTGEITGLIYRTWDGKDQPPVTAKIYVLAAHAIETAKILLMSPWKKAKDGKEICVANSSEMVGKHLMDHICLVAWGLSDEPLFQFRGPLSTSGISAFRHGDFRSEHAAFRIELGNAGWNWPTGAPDTMVGDEVNGGLFGSALRTKLHDNSTHQIRIALEMEATPLKSSYVKLSKYEDELRLPRPELHYQISDSNVPNGDYTVKGFAKAAELYPQLFKAANITDYTKVASKKGTPGLFTFDKKTYQFRGAGHVIGTYTMGAEPGTSVVDKYQRSWDHKNLFLVGSGVFPTTGTANPTLTIAALALWAAETIGKDLQSA